MGAILVGFFRRVIFHGDQTTDATPPTTTNAAINHPMMWPWVTHHGKPCIPARHVSESSGDCLDHLDRCLPAPTPTTSHKRHDVNSVYQLTSSTIA